VLALKLFLVPFFLAAVSLAGRRWGPGVAGWLAGAPLVAGPILLLLALENGAGFAARAAGAAVSAVLGTVSFNTTYAWVCARAPWPLAALAGLGGWSAAIVLVAQLPGSPWASLAVALPALAVAPRLFPRIAEPARAGRLPRSELLLRMAAGAALTLATTGASSALGAAWTGLATVFPLLSTVLAVFSHRAQGPAYAALLLRAMVRGLYSLVAFCFCLAMVLPQLGIALGFALALAVTVLVQWLARRMAP
jgi:hypothetical protein